MRLRVGRPSAYRLLRVSLLVLFLLVIGMMIEFRVQSLVFERRVHSVLSRLEQLELDKTPEGDVLRSLPELKPGILWNFYVNGRPDESCHGDACYVLRMGNLPDGILFRLRRKLEYQQDWVFKTMYWLGHRDRSFAAYVEIRAGKVSRYEYGVAVTDREYPLGELVEVQVLGADRASFPLGYVAVDSYDQIKGFKGKVPSNKPTTVMRVAFTPEARTEDVRSAFDVHLECIWNSEGCSTTRQILPAVWERAKSERSQ